MPSTSSKQYGDWNINCKLHMALHCFIITRHRYCFFTLSYLNTTF